MIRAFRVKGFKVFQDTDSIRVAPVTLLAGVNSAGKSSIIQALLVLKHTLETAKPSQALALGPGRLMEQGWGDDLGDIAFGRPSADEASLCYDIDFLFDRSYDEMLYEEWMSFGADLHGPALPEGDLSCRMGVTFRKGGFGFVGRPTTRVAELTIRVQVAGAAVVGLRFEPTGSGGAYRVDPTDVVHESLSALSWEQLDVEGLNQFIPASLIISSQPTLFSGGIPASFARFFRALFGAIRETLSERIHYLNSFRDPPQHLYPGVQVTEPLLAPRGSDFPAVLWAYGEEKVRFLFPGAQRATTGGLRQIVTRVLREVLQLPQELDVHPIGDNEEALIVRVDLLGDGGTLVGLPDVGLGYNQVLPIVIQGLLTRPGEMAIFEQPEIHLHADVQARLIDFFLGLAHTGRQVVVETHSSHMVDRLCLRTVQDRSDWVQENAQVLFVHPPDQRDASAHIERVEIDRYGTIRNYPPHFLPDIAETYEEIVTEGFAKRREAERPR